MGGWNRSSSRLRHSGLLQVTDGSWHWPGLGGLSSYNRSCPLQECCWPSRLPLIQRCWRQTFLCVGRFARSGRSSCSGSSCWGSLVALVQNMLEAVVLQQTTNYSLNVEAQSLVVVLQGFDLPFESSLMFSIDGLANRF